MSPCVCYPFLPFFRQKVTSLQLTKTIKTVYMFIFKSWVLWGTPHLLCTPHVSSHTISSTSWTLYPWSVKNKHPVNTVQVSFLDSSWSWILDRKWRIYCNIKSFTDSIDYLHTEYITVLGKCKVTYDYLCIGSWNVCFLHTIVVFTVGGCSNLQHHLPHSCRPGTTDGCLTTNTELMFNTND